MNKKRCKCCEWEHLDPSAVWEKSYKWNAGAQEKALESKRRYCGQTRNSYVLSRRVVDLHLTPGWKPCQQLATVHSTMLIEPLCFMLIFPFRGIWYIACVCFCAIQMCWVCHYPMRVFTLLYTNGICTMPKNRGEIVIFRPWNSNFPVSTIAVESKVPQNTGCHIGFICFLLTLAVATATVRPKWKCYYSLTACFWLSSQFQMSPYYLCSALHLTRALQCTVRNWTLIGKRVSFRT
jgi:hypothetical protein